MRQNGGRKEGAFSVSPTPPMDLPVSRNPGSVTCGFHPQGSPWTSKIGGWVGCGGHKGAIERWKF